MIQTCYNAIPRVGGGVRGNLAEEFVLLRWRNGILKISIVLCPKWRRRRGRLNVIFAFVRFTL